LESASFWILDEWEQILLNTVIKHRKKPSKDKPYASLYFMKWIK
jgi:hypothetical protein